MANKFFNYIQSFIV